VGVHVRPSAADMHTAVEARPQRNRRDNWEWSRARAGGIDVSCICLRRKGKNTQRCYAGTDIFNAGRLQAQIARKLHLSSPHLVNCFTRTTQRISLIEHTQSRTKTDNSTEFNLATSLP